MAGQRESNRVVMITYCRGKFLVRHQARLAGDVGKDKACRGPGIYYSRGGLELGISVMAAGSLY